MIHIRHDRCVKVGTVAGNYPFIDSSMECWRIVGTRFQRSLFIAYDCTDSVATIVELSHDVSAGVACRAENKDALLPIHAGSSSVAVERLIACDVALP